MARPVQGECINGGRSTIDLQTAESRNTQVVLIMLGAICEFAQFINCAVRFVDSVT